MANEMFIRDANNKVVVNDQAAWEATELLAKEI